MPTPVVSCPAVTINDDREPVLQDPTEPIATDEGEPQQPQENNVPQVEEQNVPEVESPRRSQRVRRSAISSDYKVYNTEEVHMEGDPTSYEEAMRSVHSSKWLEAMEDEMKSMSSNGVWDLEDIPKGAKTVGCKWVYKIKRDSRGNVERFKARLVAKRLYAKRMD